MNLNSIITNIPELGQEIFSYLSPYNDNRFIFRQLSQAFCNLTLYTKLRVNFMTSASFIQTFIPKYKIKKLHLIGHCGNIYRLPCDIFQSLNKITIDSIETTDDMHTLCQYFSRFPIESLTINYRECVLHASILGFNRLRVLNITITCKKDEQIVFDLLRVNRGTLQKLKIGVDTGRNMEYSETYKYKCIIWKSNPNESIVEPYDGSVCDDIIIRSRHLYSISLTTFKIQRMIMSRPEIFTNLYLSDVRLRRPLYFPALKMLSIQNFNLNPEHHDIVNLQMPKIQNLYINCRLIHKDFTYPSLRSMAIQNSIIKINMQDLIHRHPHLQEIIFYHNDWDVIEKSDLEDILDDRHIVHNDSDEW